MPHLDRKHTVFGRLIDDPSPSSTTLNALETHPVEPNTNRPTPEVRIKDVTIFVDPFEDFLKQKRAEETQGTNPADADDEATQRVDDDRVTWTGKRVRGAGADSHAEGPSDVGKYLKSALAERGGEEDEIVEFVDEEPEPEPVRKKAKGMGGFGDFSSW